MIEVVLVGGIAGKHGSLESELGDVVKVARAFGRAPQRRLTHSQQAVRGRVAEARQPSVVRLEARPLVVGVGVVAQHHPHGRVDDLRGHAVAILILEPRGRIPPTAVHLLEADAGDADLLGGLAGGGDETHRYRSTHPFDREAVAYPFDEDHPWRTITERRVDEVDVGLGWLGDVRVGGDAGAHARGSGVGRSGAPL